MRNILFSLILTVLTSYSYGQSEPIRALMTIKGTNLLTTENNHQVPTIPANDDVKNVMGSLKEGDEVIIEGRIHQETISYGESKRIHSYLIIDKINKVSLAELGNINFKVPEPKLSLHERPFSPVAIPVTAEVASAMTLTTSMLLLENLSSSSAADPEGRRQVRQSIMISAGLMATVLFIYEQLNGSSKP